MPNLDTESKAVPNLEDSSESFQFYSGASPLAKIEHREYQISIMKRVKEFIKYNPIYRKVLEKKLQDDPEGAIEIVERARLLASAKRKSFLT